jgi:hypothetical protein
MQYLKRFPSISQNNSTELGHVYTQLYAVGTMMEHYSLIAAMGKHLRYKANESVAIVF